MREEWEIDLNEKRRKDERRRTEGKEEERKRSERKERNRRREEYSIVYNNRI